VRCVCWGLGGGWGSPAGMGSAACAASPWPAAPRKLLPASRAGATALSARGWLPAEARAPRAGRARRGAAGDGSMPACAASAADGACRGARAAWRAARCSRSSFWRCTQSKMETCASEIAGTGFVGPLPLQGPAGQPGAAWISYVRRHHPTLGRCGCSGSAGRGSSGGEAGRGRLKRQELIDTSPRTCHVICERSGGRARARSVARTTLLCCASTPAISRTGVQPPPAAHAERSARCVLAAAPLTSTAAGLGSAAQACQHWDSTACRLLCPWHPWPHHAGRSRQCLRTIRVGSTPSGLASKMNKFCEHG
jgi:hypothetical protein